MDGGSAQVSYVYEKDYSQFEGKKIDVLAGTKVSISDLVERLKNADGTQGDMSKANFKPMGISWIRLIQEHLLFPCPILIQLL